MYWQFRSVSSNTSQYQVPNGTGSGRMPQQLTIATATATATTWSKFVQNRRVLAPLDRVAVGVSEMLPETFTAGSMEEFVVLGISTGETDGAGVEESVGVDGSIVAAVDTGASVSGS